MCQCTYLQDRDSGWHCNITIVPEIPEILSAVWYLWINLYLWNYSLYWKSAFALKWYVNQYFPWGELSWCRRSKQFIPKMVQQHHVWHWMVTLSDHANNIKTYNTNSGDLQRWKDLACVLSYTSQYLQLELPVQGRFLISVEVGSSRISFWFVSLGKYNLYSLPFQSAQGIELFLLKKKILLFQFCETSSFWNSHIKHMVEQVKQYKINL